MRALSTEELIEVGLTFQGNQLHIDDTFWQRLRWIEKFSSDQTKLIENIVLHVVPLCLEGAEWGNRDSFDDDWTLDKSASFLKDNAQQVWDTVNDLVAKVKEPKELVQFFQTIQKSLLEFGRLEKIDFNPESQMEIKQQDDVKPLSSLTVSSSPSQLQKTVKRARLMESTKLLINLQDVFKQALAQYGKNYDCKDVETLASLRKLAKSRGSVGSLLSLLKAAEISQIKNDLPTLLKLMRYMFEGKGSWRTGDNGGIPSLKVLIAAEFIKAVRGPEATNLRVQDLGLFDEERQQSPKVMIRTGGEKDASSRFVWGADVTATKKQIRNAFRDYFRMTLAKCLELGDENLNLFNDIFEKDIWKKADGNRKSYYLAANFAGDYLYYKKKSNPDAKSFISSMRDDLEARKKDPSAVIESNFVKAACNPSGFWLNLKSQENRKVDQVQSAKRLDSFLKDKKKDVPPMFACMAASGSVTG